jgi:hypothetical protein
MLQIAFAFCLPSGGISLFLLTLKVFRSPSSSALYALGCAVIALCPGWHALCKSIASRRNTPAERLNMKRNLKLALIPVALVATGFTSSLQANEITGSIGFGSLGVSIVGSSLATASSFTVSSPFITTETGAYTAAPILTPITFNGFEFNPPVSSVTPLWTFVVGAVTYSFDATSVISSFNTALNEWDIGGNGIAMVTGYTATAGTWNLNLSQSGASIVFDSSAAGAPVGTTGSAPDGGSTVMLLGGVLVALIGVGRKLHC